MESIIFSLFADLEKQTETSLAKFNKADLALKSLVFSCGHSFNHGGGYPVHLENRRLIDVSQEAYSEYKAHKTLLLIFQSFRESNGDFLKYRELIERIKSEIQIYRTNGDTKSAIIFQEWLNKVPESNMI